MKILDLGCGIGFWVVEFTMRGFKNLTAVDLKSNVEQITQKQLNTFELNATLQQENAEQLTFLSSSFDYVNCQGVIHHTPNTQKNVSEIARVLRPGGSANISEYYRIQYLKLGHIFDGLAGFSQNLGGKGRGRESIFLQKDVNQIVRLYYGDKNPICNSYTRKQFIDLLAPYFIFDETYLHFLLH